MESTSPKSMDLAEVYRVIYFGPPERLRGAIVSADEKTGFQLLFKDKGLAGLNSRQIDMKYSIYSDYRKHDKNLDTNSYPVIQHHGQIFPNGPIQTSIDASREFCISFYLFGSIHQTIAFPCLIGDPESVSVPLETTIMSRDGNNLIKMLYAVFQNAVEARVKVKFTDVKSDFSFCGVIASRTSAITHPAYSNILFFNNKDEKMQVESGDVEKDITLLRSIVGVPLESKLFLEFGLHSDGNKMVQDRLVIDVENIVHGSKVPYEVAVPCGKCRINVEIEWRCQREPNLMGESEIETEWSD